jgi:hypothetical protein
VKLEKHLSQQNRVETSPDTIDHFGFPNKKKGCQ